MAKRRSLVSGIKGSDGTDPNKESAFVHGSPEAVPPAEEQALGSPVVPEPAYAPAADAPEPIPAAPTGRSPLTTRLRSDLALALKRASLERQLAGQTPNTVQDILELALEPWLKDHGYLK